MTIHDEPMVEVFTKTITLRNGKVLHASSLGKACFHFFVKKKRDGSKKKAQ